MEENVLIGVILIGLGVTTITWGRWLTTRQLPKVRRRATSEGRERYDAIMDRPSVELLMRMPGIVGTIVVLVGVALILVEL